MARQTRQFPQGKYILRSPRKSKDGQVYAIYLYYYWQGKQVRRSIDLSVALKDWNQEANGGIGEFRPSYGANYKDRNAYLRELMYDIDSKIMNYIKQHGEIDIAYLLLRVMQVKSMSRLAFSNIVMLTRVTLGAYIDIVILLNCPKLDWNLIEQQRARWVASRNIRQLDLFDSQEGLFLETRT